MFTTPSRMRPGIRTHGSALPQCRGTLLPLIPKGGLTVVEGTAGDGVRQYLKPCRLCQHVYMAGVLFLQFCLCPASRDTLILLLKLGYGLKSRG